MDYRVCTKCGEEFEATTEFFYRDKRGKFGLRAECKVCYSKCAQEWYENNREVRAATVKKWQENNKERSAAITKKWRESNKKRIAIRGAKWRKANPDKIAAKTAKRRAKKQNQTPDLAQKEKHQIELIYKKCQKLDSDYQVDHKIPLSKGGLHHPNNLQIVLKNYNLQKGAKLNFRAPTAKEIFDWC